MKVDLKKDLVSYRARQGQFDLVSVPVMQYLMIDGHGDPNTDPAYADAVASLYPVAYRLKFHSQRVLDRDYVVMPLEARWWSDDMNAFTTDRDPSRWSWTVMMLVPDWLDHRDVDRARAEAGAIGQVPALDRLRFEPLDEGLVVQTLHVGPYADEGPVLAAMHEDFIPAHGLALTGVHHEIYLSDPRRTAPEKLRTVLRQPVVVSG